MDFKLLPLSKKRDLIKINRQSVNGFEVKNKKVKYKNISKEIY